MDFFNQGWQAVACSEDLPLRHVYQAQLLGQELALWRDDSGAVNAWENRCPHRGLRLSLGVNTGDQLKCQYHGWKYETGSGRCLFVPAHRNATPSTACVRQYPCVEIDGLVFVKLDKSDEAQTSNGYQPPTRLPSTNLRSTPAAMAADVALRTIMQARQSLAPVIAAQADSVQIQTNGLMLDLGGTETPDKLRLFVQPESATTSVVHARLYTATQTSFARKVAFIHLMEELLSLAEQCTGLSQKAKIIATDTGHSSAQPKPTESDSRKPFICTVIAREIETPDITSFWLKPDDDRALIIDPGMHASVVTPAGFIRQYSVVNAPDEDRALVIGVKNEPDSRGGSRSMHLDAAIGTKLQVTLPANQFRLNSDGRTALLIAGGVGVTPLLSMALHLQQAGRPYKFHYLARSTEHLAFAERLRNGDISYVPHLGLSVDDTRQTLYHLLQDTDPATHDIYVCGPQPMIDLVISLANEAGFPVEQINFEYFGLATNSSKPAVTSGVYQVIIKSTGKRFSVEAGKPLLQACLENGVNIDYSCEQGVCGACMTKVDDGELVHSDVYLSSKEKESGKLIMPCVSGCTSKTLTLDI